MTEESGVAEATQEATAADLEQLRQDRDAIQDRLLRLAAEFENYKKRAARDVEDTRFQAQDRLLREFLPVMDNLDRALANAEQVGGATLQVALLDGIRLVQKQFLVALERFDIRPVDALGKPFDPALHEAIQQVPTAEFPPGTVCAVFQRGFTLGPRLLLAAMVSVAQAAPASA